MVGSCPIRSRAVGVVETGRDMLWTDRATVADRHEGRCAVEIVRRERRAVIGIEVVADFDELRTAVPAAWTELFARRNELPPPMDGAFVEISAELGEGRYREVVG